MEAREEKGLVIAAQSNINKTDKGYLVPSQTGKGLYLVNVGDEPTCTVYGMPRSAFLAGNVDVMVPLPLVSREIVSMCATGRSASTGGRS